MTAPAPSPAEATTIARFGIFEAEERVEQVARAIRSEWLRILGDWADDWADASAEVRDHYRRLAAAAIAAMPASPAEEAVRRVWELLHVDGVPRHDSKTIKAGDIRDALAPQAGEAGQ